MTKALLCRASHAFFVTAQGQHDHLAACPQADAHDWLPMVVNPDLAPEEVEPLVRVRRQTR